MCYNLFYIVVAVAQLVEHLIVDQEVVGSIPIGHPFLPVGGYEVLSQDLIDKTFDTIERDSQNYTEYVAVSMSAYDYLKREMEKWEQNRRAWEHKDAIAQRMGFESIGELSRKLYDDPVFCSPKWVFPYLLAINRKYEFGDGIRWYQTDKLNKERKRRKKYE